MIRTWLTVTLGLRYPVIQAGMGPFDTADLAIAVSNAGALGVVSRTLVPIGISPPDKLRENIHKVAARSPLFAVNIPISAEYVRHKEAGTHKELILKATERDTLVVPGASGGCRVLRTPGSEAWLSEASAGFETQARGIDRFLSLVELGEVRGDAAGGLFPAGIVAGRIEDLPSVTELLARIETEADAALDRVQARLAPSATTATKPR